jgi:hypothetical protein
MAGAGLRRAEGTAGSGPFIFDPYAAKRKVASAAAAAQAALPEWVSHTLSNLCGVFYWTCHWFARSGCE